MASVEEMEEKKNLNAQKEKGSWKGRMRYPCDLALEIFTIVARDFVAKEAPQLLSENGSSTFSNHSMEGKSFSFLDSKNEPVCGSLKRKAKNEGTNPSKKHKNNNSSNNNLGQPELPREFKEKIQDLEGYDVKLMIQKELFKSDLNPNNGRFSIPIQQISQEAKNFLTQTEKSSMNKRHGGKNKSIVGLPIFVLDPNLEHHNMRLKKWKMETTFVYNITTGWNEVVCNNNLKAKDTVQLWSFRSYNQLCFAMVKL